MKHLLSNADYNFQSKLSLQSYCFIENGLQASQKEAWCTRSVFFAENCLAADAVKEVELLKVFVIQVFILVLILILQILVLLIKDDLGFSNLLPFGCLLQSLHTVVCSHKSNKKLEWVAFAPGAPGPPSTWTSRDTPARTCICCTCPLLLQFCW